MLLLFHCLEEKNNRMPLAQISHENSVNLSASQKGRNISKKQLRFLIYTAFTNGQSWKCHRA